MSSFALPLVNVGAGADLRLTKQSMIPFSPQHVETEYKSTNITNTIFKGREASS